jgi:two-component system NtrC family sensor kinase
MSAPLAPNARLRGERPEAPPAAVTTGSSRGSFQNLIQDLRSHLSFRLFLLLFGLMTVLLTVHTAFLVREQRRQLMGSVLLSATRVSDVIQRSTRTAMLRNQRAELHEMIENVGSQAGMQGVRVFNKQGVIMFSTDKGEVGQKVDLRAEACYRCHEQGTPKPSLESRDRARIFAASGHRVLGLINPIANEPACSSAACHAHSVQQTVLGVLDVRMSLEQVDTELAASQRHMETSAFVLVLVVALGFAALLYVLVQAPVARLTEGTRAVSAGILDREIPIRSRDDLGLLAASFNHMTGELRRAREENRGWGLTLEDKVRQKSEELQRAQAHLVTMDKMASLGKLSATVAHEINNPLAGIRTYARLVDRTLETATPADATATASVRHYAGMIASEAQRCGEIVQNLLVFARAAGARMEPVRLHEIIDKSLALVQHHFDLRGVELTRRLELSDDVVTCAAGEIQQALLALLVNAAEAMPSGGKLDVGTGELEGGLVALSVRDTGPGIPPEVLPRIFEPFFTTKSETKGVGLGLSVVYGIMQRHRGRVDVESHIDAGSTFTLVWPREAQAVGVTDAAPSRSDAGSFPGG